MHISVDVPSLRTSTVTYPVLDAGEIQHAARLRSHPAVGGAADL